MTTNDADRSAEWEDYPTELRVELDRVVTRYGLDLVEGAVEARREFDDTGGDVTLVRLRRVVVEARRVLAHGHGSAALHDAVDAVAYLFPERS